MSARIEDRLEHHSASITGTRLVSRMVVSILALIGALISLYLMLNHFGLTALVCPISGCDKVQASAYSSLLGIPLAAFGLAGFLIILGLGIAGLSSEGVFGIHVQGAIIWMTGLGVAAYVVLTGLELFVIHAICFWCVCSSLCMLGSLIAAFLGRHAANVRP